ncbi:helix-turn-helix domain-containing protein [Polaribacter sp.]|uniref:helix-turn-helix domain-containing protein n=1 Tax=Polaribacter sp. TaxID=1920175 RepID=UPI003F6AF1F3
MKDEYEAILNKLRLLRREKGFTQHQIGEKVCLTSTAYSKLENGHTKLDLERFLMILKILDTSLKDFFKEI